MARLRLWTESRRDHRTYETNQSGGEGGVRKRAGAKGQERKGGEGGGGEGCFGEMNRPDSDVPSSPVCFLFQGSISQARRAPRGGEGYHMYTKHAKPLKSGCILSSATAITCSATHAKMPPPRPISPDVPTNEADGEHTISFHSSDTHNPSTTHSSPTYTKPACQNKVWTSGWARSCGRTSLQPFPQSPSTFRAAPSWSREGMPGWSCVFWTQSFD